MVKRAVLYARVSTDDRGKNGRNLDGQLEMCREYAQKHGWAIVTELAEDDRGASGASFELPKLNEVLEMAQTAAFDVLVVRELDRLSRKLAKQLIVEEELKRHKVEVDYVLADYDNTPEGNLMKNMRAVVAEYERLKIEERMSRARRLKVKAGNVMLHGRPPYGYREVEVDGKQTLEIYEPEARIVRLIYQWYTRGNGEGGPLPVSAIARTLGEMRIPTSAEATDRKGGGVKKRGRFEWGRTSLYRILGSETYVGVWYYGKWSVQARKLEQHPDDYLLSVKVPAIITREVWEAAQRQKEMNLTNASRNRKHEYLLSRRIRCAMCGSAATGYSVKASGKVYQYYQCIAYAGHVVGVECNMRYFRADHVDAAVWEWVKSLLTDPEALADGMSEYQREQEKATGPIRDRVAVTDDLLARNRGQLQRLLDLYLSGDIPKEMLTDRKTRLEATIEALEKERTGLAAHLENQALTDEHIQSLQDFAAKVTDGLEMMDDDFKARRHVIELLDLRATLALEEERKVVYARCIVGDNSLSVAPLSSDTRDNRNCRKVSRW